MIFVIYCSVSLSTLFDSIITGVEIIKAGTDSNVDIGSSDKSVQAAAGLREETMNEKYQLQDKQLQNAGTAYALFNIALFILPLIGILYFIHFFCSKDSLGKRRRLVWAINLIMIYSVLFCIFHIVMMTRVFGFVGMLLSI